MAVALEFVNAIFRKDSIAAKFPGGLEAFFGRYKYYKILFDDALVVVTFLSNLDAMNFANDFGEFDFEEGADFTILDSDEESGADWLETGTRSGIRAAWVKGEVAGDIVKSIDYDMFFLEGRDTLKSFFRNARADGFRIGANEGAPGQVLSGKQVLACREAERVVVEYFATDMGKSFIVAIHPENPGTPSEYAGALSAILGRLCLRKGEPTNS